jgi:hypothetical protein
MGRGGASAGAGGKRVFAEEDWQRRVAGVDIRKARSARPLTPAHAHILRPNNQKRCIRARAPLTWRRRI